LQLFIADGVLRPPFALERPSKTCPHCGAIVWNEEEVKGVNKKYSHYAICCKNGNFSLPLLRKTPKKMLKLMDPARMDPQARRFREHIRSFNSMFAMTSHGAQVDYTVMHGKGPYTFRMHGQNYHAIGTLIPVDEYNPKYAQLYIYDTHIEIENSYESLARKKEQDEIEK